MRFSVAVFRNGHFDGLGAKRLKAREAIDWALKFNHMTRGRLTAVPLPRPLAKAISRASESP